METVGCNGGHLGPFIIRNEGVTNGVPDNSGENRELCYCYKQ